MTTATKQYALIDTFDGRTVHLIPRVSSRPLARKVAAKFMRSYYDTAALIEIVWKDGETIRNHVATYGGAVSRAKSPFTRGIHS